ncbi:tRNA epoxyqueuosine(34) reductase QueG [Oceanithermus sp.]
MEPLAELAHAARRRGFLVYPAPARLPEAARAGFEAWLAAGRHAGMDYLARDPRERFELWRRFPWFRGALVLARPYAAEPPPRPAGGLRIGRVARYAWVRDYHLWIAPLLAELEEECRRLGGRCRGYVDYGPVPERAFAAASGGGWLGRNGLWLTQEAGSYQYLAVLLTSWEVEEQPPHPDRCGSCRACQRACPTGAILAGGVVDSRLCLSYWTIEHRGLLPLELWEPLDDRLFGCDDCQTVCPWNRRRRLQPPPPPDPELAWPDLESFFGVSNRAFARRYAGTAFLRGGRPVLARNALVVLSNRDRHALLRLLPAALADPSPKVRATAAAAAVRAGATGMALAAANNLDEAGSAYLEQALAFFG